MSSVQAISLSSRWSVRLCLARRELAWYPVPVPLLLSVLLLVAALLVAALLVVVLVVVVVMLLLLQQLPPHRLIST